jgi:hypothetical protein
MLILAFEEETMSRIQTFDWFSKFKSGVTCCVQDAHSGAKQMKM